MNIYISTLDRDIHIIEAFQHFFNEYWGKYPVTVLGYKLPRFELAPNFTFVSLGKDRGPRICGELFEYFSGIDDEHFIWSVGDQVIVRPLNQHIYKLLAKVITQDAGVGRASLVENIGLGASYSVLRKHSDYHLIEQAQDDEYRLSAVWSIWRKEYFLKYLRLGMDLWEWETRDHARHDGWRILGTADKHAISSAHILARGRLHPDSFHSWDKLKAEMSEAERALVLRIARQAGWTVAGDSVAR